MAERYCPSCGTRIDTVAEACASCGRNLPGTGAHRREVSEKRKTAMWSIALGLVITVLGYQFLEGGPRIIDTRWGPSTAGILKGEVIVAGLAFVGYGVFSLYRLRDDA